MTASAPVGLIGLGVMGSAYAANPLKRGHDALGFDAAAPARERLLAAGGGAGGRERGRRRSFCVLFGILKGSTVTDMRA